MRRSVLPCLTVALVAAGCGGNGGGTTTPPVESKSASVVAGGGTTGADNGPLASATFNNPVNVAIDTDGTVFVCDFDNNLVRKISGGMVSTLVDQANFARPFGITIAPNGNLYVSTDDNDTGTHSAESGTVWQVNKNSGAATVVARDLGRPRGILALGDGRIALANLTHSTVDILNPANGNVTLLAGQMNAAGFAEGTGAAAQFNRPYGMTLMPDGSILVADQNNFRIRQVTMGGVVTTFAGAGTAGAANGPVGTATFQGPQDVDRAGDGRIFVSDSTGHTIRVISGGQVGTFAGNGTAGFAEGTGTNAQLNFPEGSAIDWTKRVIYVADGSGGEDAPFHRVRFFRL